MIIRRDTLEQALGEVEAQALSGASTIVVSRHDAIPSHFVEIRGDDEGPPLSSERHM